MESFGPIQSWLVTLALILLGEFPTCLGVYEHIRNRASLSDTYPYFDATSERNVTSFVGQVTHLHCTVRDIGDRTVSWIRKSDLHVLTSDVLTFTGDQRFSAHHASESDSWTLQIKYTQLRDEGEYQCQVNTEPKISFSVFLMVEEAEARIDSPSNKEVHVKQRSQVKLTCLVDLGTGSGSESAAVFWYLDGEALDWLGQTGPGRGVRVTERRERQLISTLIIEKADIHHAGKFTCAPSYAKPDTVTLHVIDGESRAELQGNGDASTAAATSLGARGSFEPSSRLVLVTSTVLWSILYSFLILSRPHYSSYSHYQLCH